ncbi:MAG: glycosyl hydrolase 53 family protein, partial [Gammaproteobacteria bacterium]|nr:glycosyl hydrolase 53 family protein [Gammaproteobacteria bacterium]
NNLKNLAAILSTHDLDYDVFGVSYYPYWHGTLSNLSSVLDYIGNTYDKYVMVMETSYANSLDNYDFHNNTSLDTGYTKPHDYTQQGQYDQIYDVIKAISSLDKGLGVCYWEGTWIGVGYTSYEENQVKWETYGSGWASSYSAEYDPNDAGRYYGGCAIENQAFFDKDGYVLNSIDVFNQPRGITKPKTISLLSNGSFEESWDLSPWALERVEGTMDTVQISNSEHYDGERALNVYSTEAASIKLTQTFTNAPAGYYTLRASTMGGASSEGYVYIQVFSKDKRIGETSFMIIGSMKWMSHETNFDSLDSFEELKLVIYVVFTAPESWAFIDNIKFTVEAYN